MRTTEQRLRAMDKKARRQMRHKAKGGTIEGAINVAAASLIQTSQWDVDVNQLYGDAKDAMSKRVKLSNQNDATGRKARRELNNWKLGRDQRPVTGYWNPEGKRAAR